MQKNMRHIILYSAFIILILSSGCSKDLSTENISSTTPVLHFSLIGDENILLKVNDPYVDAGVSVMEINGSDTTFDKPYEVLTSLSTSVAGVLPLVIQPLTILALGFMKTICEKSSFMIL